MKKNKTKAILLSVVWAASLLLTSAHAGIRQLHLQLSNIQTNEAIGKYEFILLFLCAGYFLPISIKIQKYSKLGKLPKLEKFFSYVTYLFAAMLLITPFALVLMFFVNLR